MTPRIHHVCCGTMCPIASRLTGGTASLPARMVCHCLVVETDAGLVLVDTGIGVLDCTDPRRLPRLFRAITRPRFHIAETARGQIQALGLDPRDVRAIVCTHLDLDHAGGLPDFPDAEVHVLEPEHVGATQRLTFAERHRYAPVQFEHGPRWKLHVARGERWHGFDAVQALGPQFGAEILLVPLGGHTRGHAGIAVRGKDGWVLHAGDAYFYRGELDPIPSCPVGLSAFQRMIAFDDPLRRANQERLRQLHRDEGDIRIVSAHDPVELERAQASRDSDTPGS